VTHVSRRWWDDDAALLAELHEALRAAKDVPAEFVAAGKAVWGATDLDAELAELVYDSVREPAGVRTDNAALRALTFASPTQIIELEIGDSGLQGQLVPPSCCRIEVEARRGGTASAISDELGYFSLASVPDGPFRLRCRVGAGTVVVTSWITI
jgi:hypothetical protein